MGYRLKLIITILLLIAISFGIGGTLMITTSFRTNKEKEIQSALTAFENTQNILYLLNGVGNQTGYQSLVDALLEMEKRGFDQWQALIVNAGSETIYSNGNLRMLAYELPAPREKQCCSQEVSDKYGHGLLVKSLIAAGDRELEIIARFDLSRVYNLRQAQQRQYLITYIAVVHFGALAAVTFSFALTRHLRRLTSTVREITGGDMSKRSQIQANDEFGQLSRDFDTMADKLQETISKLEADMQRQENFMGAFAHELKTPMTSIIGFADLLRQGNMDENDQIMAADYIYSEGHRLERLSFKLLDLLLLKKDTVIMKQVWLEPFMGEIQRALTPNMENKRINLVCAAEQKMAVLEPDLVKSLLYNLVDNAAKAMEEGGTVTVCATAIDGGCRFRVEDTGRGMKPEELTKITDAFYRVDKARSRSQGGAGLGLTLCKQIAQLHNGYIQFQSEPGKGTVVTVTLYGKTVQTGS